MLSVVGPPVAMMGTSGNLSLIFRTTSGVRAAAEIFTNNLKLIYPIPSLSTVVPTTSQVELRRTRATAVLEEIAYHDNIDDANWSISIIEEIAANLALSVADFLGVAFVMP